MKTEKELNEDIIKITTTIRENFPELTKYITEIPLNVADPGSSEIAVKNLQEYFDSLEAIVKKYAPNHL